MAKKEYPTAKMSEVVAMLQRAIAEVGDGPIVMSSDPEGNSYGTIRVSNCLGKDEKLTIMYPWDTARPEAF